MTTGSDDGDLRLNDGQRRLVEETEGVYLVDAGAGTGKTLSITRRYSRLVGREDVEPDDVLLATFTRNAADEMRRRIVRTSDYGVRRLKDASIDNFHGIASEIVGEHGHRAPRYLGVDEVVAGSTDVLDDAAVEEARFQRFYKAFVERHPEHHEYTAPVDDPGELLDLVNSLAAKGVFPTADGWYRGLGSHLDGDRDEFDCVFTELNQPRNDGGKQSRLRKRLGGYGRDRVYSDGAPAKARLRGERGSKQVPDDVADLAFEEDRSALKEFVHDVYFEYLEHALERNYLNFGFLQMLAFVLLCEDDPLRRRLQHRYVMIDEFQDTSEIQFKLALLLAGEANICAVGDWKQSIYSFQYADVDNIREFERRLHRYTREIDDGGTPVPFTVDDVEEITLKRNYRSTQEILDFAEEALVAEGSKSENVDADEVRDEVAGLEADTSRSHSRIEAQKADDEHEAVVAKLQETVEDDDLMVRGEDGELRPAEYGDVAVFTRTRDWGRELLETAETYGVPVAYEGGVELYRTDQAKLLLAWMRVLDGDAERGWPPVLEHMGYTLDEIEEAVENEELPTDAVEFHSELRDVEDVPAVARRILDRYGFTGATADALVAEVESVRSQTEYTLGEIADYIADGVDRGSTVDVETGGGEDSVKVQTIHAAKGLEYPVVVLANVNRYQFPATGAGGGGAFWYSDISGIRQKKIYGDTPDGDPYIYRNWRYDVLRHVQRKTHDEERRLLYVALTRARDHLVLSAETGRESEFLENLSVDVEEHPREPRKQAHVDTTQTEFTVPAVTPDGPRVVAASDLAEHDLGEHETDVETDGRKYGGKEFGSIVHRYAEDYALDRTEKPPQEIADTPDVENIRRLVDSLDGELHVEEEVYLPVDVEGERVLVRGVADLVEVTGDAVRVVDYKTDRTRERLEGYRKQVGVYRRVLEEVYPDRGVRAGLFFTVDGESVTVEAGDVEAIREKVASQL